MTSKRLIIVQDYVPQYRVGFFGRLVKRLKKIDVDCLVLAGPPPGLAQARRDSIDDAPWLRNIGPPWEFWPSPKWPRFFGYGTDRHWRDADGVIMGLRGAALDLHMELARKSWSHRRIGVWGHLSRHGGWSEELDLTIEKWQMQKCDHVFAYTQAGFNSAVSDGIPARKVTAVMNSIDVSGLIDSYSILSLSNVQSFMEQHALIAGKTFGFIGGVDATKRVGFLADALDLVWVADREVKLLLAGRGEQQAELEPAVSRGQVVMLGYAGDAVKAMTMRVSQALVNPGRVGLIAVESLAIGIPVLTTDWRFHAPEYEYLEVGRDVVVSDDDVSAFASLILEHATSTGEVRPHQGRPYPHIDEMVGTFAGGVEKMLA